MSFSDRDVSCSATFTPTWVKSICPDPRSSVAEMRRRAEEARDLQARTREQVEASGSGIHRTVEKLNERFGKPFRQRQNGDEPPYWGTWTWKEATVMIATALGAPEPAWDETSRSWWFDQDHGLFADVRKPADVARIPVPDWANTPPVIEMLEAQARWREAFPGDPAHFDMLLPLYIPRNRWMIAAGYPSFIDTGICLLGISDFLSALAGDTAFACALMDKCFELITGYGDFLLSRTDVPVSGWVGFGGDVSTMLSPHLCERYGNGFDARLFDYLKRAHGASEDAPWNLHSCGPSAHLYEVWGRHPHRSNIAVMQTRLIPGEVARLRHSLPLARLELTVHPGHFDIASAHPGQVRNLIRHTIRDAGCRDLAINVMAVAHAPANLPRLQENLAACYETMLETEESLNYSDLGGE